MPSIAISPPGVISQGEVYARDEFLRRVRWSEDAFSRAKRRGLRVKYLHGRVYIPGDAFIEYVASGKDEKDAPA